MALEDIFRALEEQADKDVEAILEEAHAQADVIVEEAKREADSARDARVAEAERLAVARSSQDLNSVRLDARKRIASVKERAVSEVFETARESLVELRQRPDYDQIFRSLGEEALGGITEDFELWVDPSDIERGRALLSEKGLSAEVKPEISTAGGVVVATHGGTVLRRNTVEKRLDKLRGLAQADVAEIVFA